MQETSTICEADALRGWGHGQTMLSHAELLDEIRRRRDAGATTNAELARLLDLPTSRIADIFATDRKARKIAVDEMKILVEHFGLESERPEAEPISEELLTPIVQEIVKQGKRSTGPSDLRPLVVSLARYLQQIARSPAIHANPDALKAVAEAVAPPIH